ncbi:MAG: dTDP-4-dehydrorhamnose reductase [Simkaniaceae bacterium]|nr:dTDP-4-dehydrorhamnose reductase [Candidatus Sacchlamyda saccharinae]
MKIWILGAGGLLGCALIDCCQAQGISFVASKRKDADITDLGQLDALAKKHQCTHIINCAAFTNVDGAEKESRAAYLVNSTGAENTAQVARENGMRLVHVSTDYVFDGEKTSPYTEEDVPSPLNIYGKSKWEGEQRVLEQFPSACIVRTSWVFGHEGSSFISSVMKWLKDKEHIQAVEDQINRATYNRDLAQVLIDLCCHSGLYHFANAGALSRFRIAEDFYSEARARGMSLKCQKITPVSYSAFPVASVRPNYSVLDTSKVTKALGRSPRSWETVLKEYIDAL